MKYHILTYHMNNTYAKLAPDTLQNKNIKEIMRYTGGYRTSPLKAIRYESISLNRIVADKSHRVKFCSLIKEGKFGL